MAVYKVPQDVEAEDKLLGPFTFKQFVYLLIAAIGSGLAYGLFQILIPLALIPLPIVIFFAVLALPLRKDQPMEVYLAAVVSFLTRPRVRIWRADGIEYLIKVVAPKGEKKVLSKSYSEEEVRMRLSYLADLTDSQGWSIRGIRSPHNLLSEDLYHEAQAATDLLDETGDRIRQIDNLLEQTDTRRRQQLMEKMKQPAESIAVETKTISYDMPSYSPSDPYSKLISPNHTPMSAIQPENADEDIKLVVNPYPVINQLVITPLGQDEPVQSPAVYPEAYQEPVPAAQTAPPQAPVQPQPPSEEPISPAIIDLANNHNDLSIETLGREANRIKQKELKLKENEEILISLR